MKLWLANKWDALRGSFWFLPSLMVIAAIVLSLMMIHLDRATADQNWAATLGWTFSRGPEGSRALLATVAGSMMTIASVTFSITIVALQLASSQFGPRLLRNFMRDRGNQVAIGTFIATLREPFVVLDSDLRVKTAIVFMSDVLLKHQSQSREPVPMRERSHSIVSTAYPSQ